MRSHVAPHPHSHAAYSAIKPASREPGHTLLYIVSFIIVVSYIIAGHIKQFMFFQHTYNATSVMAMISAQITEKVNQKCSDNSRHNHVP